MQQSNPGVSYGMNDMSRSEINNEETRRQFENSIASLADIYTYGKRGIEMNNINSDRQLKNNNTLDLRQKKYSVERIKHKNTSESRMNKNNDNYPIYTSLKSNENNTSYYSNNTRQYPSNTSPCIEITCLRPSVSKQSAKFSKIKAGKINPPKSNFSIKKETDKKIKEHEEGLRGYTLNAHKLEIEKNKFIITEKKSSQYNYEMEEQYSKRNQDGENENIINEEYIGEDDIGDKNMIIVGERYPAKLNWSLKSTNKNPNYNLRPGSSQSRPENFQDNSSKERRNIIKKYEQFYSNTKDFFFSNDQKVPSHCNIDDIITNVEDVRGSLERFKKEYSKDKGKGSYLLKDSVAGHKKFKITERSYKPLYIEEENRKKIEERLEMLHLEIRNTMDNINKIENKDEKLNELINKSQNLSEILQKFSGRLRNDNEDSYENKNMDKSLQIRYNHDNINYMENGYNMNSFGKTQAGFNQEPEIKSNEVDEVLEVLKGGTNNSDAYGIYQNKDKQLNSDRNLTQSGNNNNNKNYNESCTNFKNINQSTNFQNLDENKEDSRYKFTSTNNNFNDFNKTYNNSTFSNLDRVNMGQSIMYKTNDNLFKEPIKGQNNCNYTPANYSSTNMAPNQSTSPDSLIGNNNNFVSNNYNYNQASLPGSNHNYNNNINSFSISNLGGVSQVTSNNKNETFDQKFSGDKIKSDQQKIICPESNTDQLVQANPLVNAYGHKNGYNFDTSNIISDDKHRLTSYDIELPVDYYHRLSKRNQPQSKKDWCIRAHHLETFSGSENAIADDILNTKYISYYGPAESIKNEKSSGEKINEIIENLESKIDSLKYELYQKSNNDREFKQIYKKMDKLKVEYLAGKESKQGKYYNKNNSNIKENENNIDPYDKRFIKNPNIEGKNVVINSYECLLENLRNEEKELLISKRKEEFERIRPPVEKWWEMRNREFKGEMQRNKIVLNAPGEYFDKLEELKNNDLF